MVLDDALVIEQSVEGFNKGFDPKALGAFNLHELTRDRALDFFVLLSSVTTSIGNPGQSNYVAGNLYLESLALRRLALGLPRARGGVRPHRRRRLTWRATNGSARRSLRAREVPP